MKDIFKSVQALFQPEYITGLSFDSRHISAIRITHSLKGNVIDHSVTATVNQPEQIVTELKEFSENECLINSCIHTCLPTSRATLRHIPIPIENATKLSKIIKYQMEPHVPSSIDDMIVDFIPHYSGEKVLAAGVKKEVVIQHLELLDRAGIAPQTICLDDIALITLFHHTSGPISSDANVILHLNHEQTTVMVIKEKRLLFIRTLSPIKKNCEAVIETLNLFKLEQPDSLFSHILITGNAGVNEALANDISLKVKIPTTVWQPFDHIDHRLGHLDVEAQLCLSIPLGLALCGINSKGKTFDLRKESFAIRSFEKVKKLLLYTSFASIVFVFLFTISVYQKLFSYKNMNAQLQHSMQELYVQSFPGAKPIKGQAFAQMKQKVDEEARYKVADTLNNGDTALSILMLLTEVLSEFNDLIIHQFSIEGNDLNIYGSASTFERVDRIMQAIETTGVFQQVKLLDAKMDKKENAVRFNISLRKKR